MQRLPLYLGHIQLGTKNGLLSFLPGSLVANLVYSTLLLSMLFGLDLWLVEGGTWGCRVQGLHHRLSEIMSSGANQYCEPIDLNAAGVEVDPAPQNTATSLFKITVDYQELKSEMLI